MERWYILACAAIPFVFTGCAHTPPAPPPQQVSETNEAALLKTLHETEYREVVKAASRRLDDARRLLSRGDVDGAEAALQPLVGQNLFPSEVSDLRDRIRAAREQAAFAQGKREAERRALGEVDERFTLPSTYSTAVTISGQSGALAVPKGPMEELFSRRVDIKVQNAGVSELVQALTQIEGLNIIADDALEAAKSLTIDVRNAPLGEVLSYIARNMGVAFHLGENIVWVTQSEEQPGSGPKLETQVYRLRRGFVPALRPSGGGQGGERGGGGGAPSPEDTELEDALDAVLADSPEGATYRLFRNRNLLMVRDTRQNLRLVEQVIEDFDRAPRQVLIEARFITIGQDDLRDVGVELAQTSTPDPLNPMDPESLRLSNVLSTFGAAEALQKGGQYGQMVLGGVMANRTFEMVISAIDRRSSAKTLSAPRVTVLNNRTARIRRGDKVLYYDELETVAASGGGDGGSAAAQTAFTGSPKELELGVTLEVKVSVGNDDQTVLLGLAPEVIELKRWRRFSVVAGGTGNNNTGGGSTGDNEAMGDLELPETTESTVSTAVAVRSGETVVLGGLVSANVQKDVRKIPLLGDIPGIGFLFRHTTEKDVPMNLLIFVTARVIDDSGRFVEIGAGGNQAP